MILQECRAVKRVSIMQVDALKELLMVMDRFVYPLDLVKDVFTTIESPTEKLERISKLDKPLEYFDYRRLLDHLWEYQGGVGDGELTPWMAVWQQYYRSGSIRVRGSGGGCRTGGLLPGK